MPTFRFDAALLAANGLPEDAMINTWHFESNDPIIDDFDNVRDMLMDFYNLDPGTLGTTGPISSWMSDDVLSGFVGFRAYDLSDPEPRVPVYTASGELTNLGSTVALPNEVALVLSFQAAPASGTNAARRRNRKYIGGLSTGTVGTAGRPTSVVVNTIAGAARRMKEASSTSVTWDWVVYSPTDNATYDVDSGWVDDAWDTQRRRGLAPTGRVAFNSDDPADE